MRLTANKGEWSELYALLKLLASGRLYAADSNVNRIDDQYFPILRIYRQENNKNVEFTINDSDGTVDVNLNASFVRKIDRAQLEKLALYMYEGIVSGQNRSFSILGSDKIMSSLECEKITAPSTDKTDITMQLHDIRTSFQSVCGFSIKSELGNPPTLLNASGSTNFVYEISGISDSKADSINAIETKTKILDRMSEINANGLMKFSHCSSNTFSENLMFIDSYMEDIIGDLLIDFYNGNAADCKTLISRIEERNPLGYPRKGIYEYKFKKFLCSVALGMMPAKVWNGRDEANGGYIIVKDDGDVVAFHLYNRDAFETYLLNNTRLERASTSRHGFASLYKNEKGKMCINLNLQIRFI